MKSKVRMKISTQGGEKEKKEHKTGFFMWIGPHTSFTLSFGFVSKVRMKISTQGGEKDKKERAKQVFSHELVFTQVSPPVLELPSPQLYLDSYSPLNQRLVWTNNSCKCCDELLKFHSLFQLHSNWGWNRDLEGDKKPGWF